MQLYICQWRNLKQNLNGKLHFSFKKQKNKQKKRLSGVKFSKDDILSIIRSEKPQCHNKISIRDVKAGDKTICKPLNMTYTPCLKKWVFPHLFEKQLTLFLSIKNKKTKNSKELITRFTNDNNLIDYWYYYKLIPRIGILLNHSSFKQGHSSINQLLLITHEIYNEFHG